MTFPHLHGAIPALITPFRDGAVDEAAFRKLVERQIEGGVHAVVPVGTTGEVSTLSHDEHKRVVELCIEIVDGRVPVIAGAGANATSEAIDLMRHAKAVGADAALVVTPYYNRPSQDGLFRHYAAINDAVELPVLIYNVPSRTGVDISNDTVARLSDLPNIAGIKDATGDMARPSVMRLDCKPGFILLSGDDPSAVGYVAHGGHGCISVTANVAPRPMASLMEAAIAGDFTEARRWQERLIALHKALFLDASPAPTKFALAELGLCSPEARLPIGPCAEGVKPAIREAMRRAGVL
jgi:4-hydroxy-tetrahydrodipicolinate synthase